MLAWVIAPASVLAGSGCNSALIFSDRTDAGGGDHSQVSNGDAPPDLPGTVDTRGDDLAAPDVPADMAMDTPPDAPPDLPPDLPPDVPPDLPRDVLLDLPRDLPREAIVDAGGPVVCTQSSQCVLSTLHCLLVTGQPGQCVECLSDADCGGRRCDTAVSHRCVECVDNSPCPTTDDSHPSVCIDNHCQNGCDDSNPVCPAGTAAGFTCQAVNGAQICVGCPGATCPAVKSMCVHNLCSACAVNTDCSGATPICDLISGTCVQCKTSVDCKTSGMRICDPVLLRCVTSP
jgi:Cys-rich repeat protein